MESAYTCIKRNKEPCQWVSIRWTSKRRRQGSKGKATSDINQSQERIRVGEDTIHTKNVEGTPLEINPLNFIKKIKLDQIGPL